ncbi:helix-turn-helix domain-containing protein [Clostridium tertium]|uniref:helix-turn-helix domain-containing protein n=1 Tax=Clostridium tertium TaxID=1559 RepID=UPI0024B36083|nr:helix-turn-helix transcriptional regulator [Clostridium tertium]MDI9215982.1 helix-turn-helix transcriptional regulator [Clostridium tertium]
MGIKLKQRRKELEMSVYDLAKKTGISPAYISNLENGQKNNPSKDVMEKISISLGKTVSELFF